MDISNYTDFFHDGAVIKIKHQRNKIEFLMLSCELDPDDIKNSIVLSRNSNIQGILHVDNIKTMKIDEKPFNGVLKNIKERAHIFDFEIDNNWMELSVEWVDRFSKPEISNFMQIEIEAGKIWWENIPNLEES